MALLERLEGEDFLLKPENDKKSYRFLKLENELQVFLISDPETDKAAAAMAVSVGYFSDPEDVPGLAHFLEHMLFFSSEKYPLEDSYSIFLNEHGGRSNAYTSSEHTNYHLDVSHQHLEEALHRFAQFFICPLLSPDATDREMNAVNSENSKNLTSDPWRINQLHKSFTSTSHPYHKYGTGNLETLDSGPKSNGKNVLEELLKFYTDLYSSNLMRLVVYGRNSLDELEKMTVEKFLPIKNKKRADIKFPGQPCDPEHLKLLLKAVPVTEGHSLELHFPIPPEISKYKNASSRFLGHLIGHEADGSLFSLIKAKGWATGLSAGETESSHDYAFFVVSIELTEEGQDHMKEILGLFFSYVDILKNEGGVAQWIFDEVRAVCETKFHFQDKRPPFQLVTSLSFNMLTYPKEDWLAGASLPREFDENAIIEVLDKLTPENLRIVWCSKNFEKESTETEKWYGTKYSVENIDSSTLEFWKNGGTKNGLALPVKNEFIPTDFSLREPISGGKYPIMVHRSPMTDLWFKSDPIFRTPKAVIQLDFTSPSAYSSPETAVLTRIFTKLLVDYLNEHAYYAEIAGLSYSVQSTALGFQVSVSGYNHKIFVLASKIIEKMVNFEVREDRFKDIKEKTQKDFLNFQYEQPYQQALYAVSVLLEHKRWHWSEYTELLPNLGPQDLQIFYPLLLSRLSLVCYITGNLTVEEAVDFVKKTEKTLSEGPLIKSKPLFSSQRGEKRIVKLKPGESWIYPTLGFNPKDENSSLLFYLQVSQDSPLSTSLSQLLVQTATRDAFHQLRTVEQLGYIVFLVPRNDSGVHGIQCIIQSNVKNAGVLENRVELFLANFAKKLEAMTEEEFQMHVDALVSQKEEKHKNLTEEARFFWREIDDGTLLFDRVAVEVAALRKLSLSDLKQFYDQFVRYGGQFRSKLSSQVYGGPYAEIIQKLQSQKIKTGEDEKTTTEKKENLIAENGEISDEKTQKIQKMDDKDQQDSSEKDNFLDFGEVIEDPYSFKCSQMLFGSLRGRPVSNL